MITTKSRKSVAESLVIIRGGEHSAQGQMRIKSCQKAVLMVAELDDMKSSNHHANLLNLALCGAPQCDRPVGTQGNLLWQKTWMRRCPFCRHWRQTDLRLILNGVTVAGSTVLQAIERGVVRMALWTWQAHLFTIRPMHAFWLGLHLRTTLRVATARTGESCDADTVRCCRNKACGPLRVINGDRSGSSRSVVLSQ